MELKFEFWQTALTSCQRFMVKKKYNVATTERTAGYLKISL